MVELKRSEFKIVASLDDIPDGYFDENQSVNRLRVQRLVFDGWKFNHSLLKSCEFEGCEFQSCIFDRMDFQRVSFHDCVFTNCVFGPEFRFITGAMNDCVITDCDLTGAFVQNVRWARGEVTGSSLDRLKAKSLVFDETRLEAVTFDRASIVRGDFRTVADLQRSLFYTAYLDDCDFAWDEVFVVMQFGDPELENLYTYGIVPVLEGEFGVECRRVDQYEFKGRITDEILQNIVTARAVVAECSAANKNVYFEVGYALGRNKDVVFLADDADSIPFDLHDYKFLIHGKRIDTLKEQLRSRMSFLLGKP